jgi:hypothetical protein
MATEKPYIAVGKMQRFVILQQVVFIVTTGLQVLPKYLTAS